MSRLTKNTHPLITEEVLQRLKNYKIYNEIDFIHKHPNFLVAVTKLNYKDVCAVKQYFKSFLAPINALTLLNDWRKNHTIIPTGIESLDVVLDGGFDNNRIYEVCGLPGSGKTLFCLTLTKNYLKQFDGVIYYIDTKNDFNPTKLKEMVELDEIHNDHIIKQLSKVHVMQCNTKFDLLNSLHDIKDKMKNELHKNYLIIIDSLPAMLYSNVNYKRDVEILRNIVKIMNNLTAKCYVPIVITNFVSKVIQNNQFINKIEGGQSWQHRPSTRLMIEKFGDKFKISIVNSTDLPKPNLSMSATFSM